MSTKVDLSPGYFSRSNDNCQLDLLLAVSHPAPPHSLSKNTLHNCPLFPWSSSLHESAPLRGVIMQVDVSSAVSPGVWGAGDEGGALKCGGPDEDFTGDVGTQDRPTFLEVWHHPKFLTPAPPLTPKFLHSNWVKVNTGGGVGGRNMKLQWCKNWEGQNQCFSPSLS